MCCVCSGWCVYVVCCVYVVGGVYIVGDVYVVGGVNVVVYIVCGRIGCAYIMWCVLSGWWKCSVHVGT